MPRLPLLLTLTLSLALAGCAGNSAIREAVASGQTGEANPPAGSLSNTSFDFGENFIGNTVTQSVVTITNTGGTPLGLKPVLSGDPGFSLDPDYPCGANLPSGASCAIVVQYTPRTPSAPAQQTATLNLNLVGIEPGTPDSVTLTGTAAAMPAGSVSPSANPQVALYSVNLPANAKAVVDFGKDTSYGRQTWTVPAPPGGGPVTIEVAGMQAATTYHLRALFMLPSGVVVNDADHAFTTGPLPPQYVMTVNAAATSGLTPQPGIELLDSTWPNIGAFATDLQGNVIWTYPFADASSEAIVLPVTPLANGDFLILSADRLQVSTAGAAPIPSTVSFLREIDLAGNTIRQVTVAQVDAQLQQEGYNFVVSTFSHDVIELPNGHLLVIGLVLKNFTNLPGYPGTIGVSGDVVLDLDQNLHVAWVWNAFDQMDINRHPWSFPDWTHANSILYSKDDGNILLSLRHQNWVIKINYQDGTGDGRVLWHLGEGGDFKLLGGTDPTDWFYAQHGMSYFSQNTTGIFSLGLMDNGDDRIFPPGVTCGAAGAPPCLYTTIPVMQIDESTKAATLVFHQVFPPKQYSFFGGNTQLMPDGNIAFDLCGLSGMPSSEVYEVTPGSNPQTIWQLNLNSLGANLYRALREPSLYPGVTW